MSPARSQSRSAVRRRAAAAAEGERTLRELTPGERSLVREAWEGCRAAPGDFAAELYGRLFELAPPVAQLFPGDMTQQRRRLTATLEEAVDLLEQPEQLILLLRASGVRHLFYRVDYDHFGLLAAATRATLVDRLGDRFDDAHAAAWDRFYAAMTAVMSGAMAAALAERV